MHSSNNGVNNNSNSTLSSSCQIVKKTNRFSESSTRISFINTDSSQFDKQSMSSDSGSSSLLINNNNDDNNNNNNLLHANNNVTVNRKVVKKCGNNSSIDFVDETQTTRAKSMKPKKRHGGVGRLRKQINHDGFKRSYFVLKTSGDELKVHSCNNNNNNAITVDNNNNNTTFNNNENSSNVVETMLEQREIGRRFSTNSIPIGNDLNYNFNQQQLLVDSNNNNDGLLNTNNQNYLIGGQFNQLQQQQQQIPRRSNSLDYSCSSIGYNIPISNTYYCPQVVSANCPLYVNNNNNFIDNSPVVNMSNSNNVIFSNDNYNSNQSQPIYNNNSINNNYDLHHQQQQLAYPYSQSTPINGEFHSVLIHLADLVSNNQRMPLSNEQLAAIFDDRQLPIRRIDAESFLQEIEQQQSKQ
ncbi:hypothetical protein ABK040_004470 [Willaertia magna]